MRKRNKWIVYVLFILFIVFIGCAKKEKVKNELPNDEFRIYYLNSSQTALT